MINYVLSDLIGIDDIIVDNIEHTKNEVIVTARTKKSKQICPFCNNDKVHINEYNIQKIKDLSISGKYTLLFLTKRRYKYYKCKKTFLENLNCINKSQRITKRLYAKILEELSEVTAFTSIARKYGISVNSVIRIFDRINYTSTDLNGIKTLGID